MLGLEPLDLVERGGDLVSLDQPVELLELADEVGGSKT